MVRIRLRRMGAKKKPFYRVVVADSNKGRNGSFAEVIGTYDPMTNPSTIKIHADKALAWLKNGAQPTDTAKYLLEESGVWGEFMSSKGVAYTPKPKAAPKPAPAPPAPEPVAAVVEETPVVVEEVVTEEPVAEAVAEESATEEPSAEEPVVEEPVAEVPASEEAPPAEEPAPES